MDVSYLIDAAQGRADAMASQGSDALRSALSSMGVLTSVGTLPAISLPTLPAVTLPPAPPISEVRTGDIPERPQRPQIGGIDTVELPAMPAAPQIGLEVREPAKPSQGRGFDLVAPAIHIDAQLPTAPDMMHVAAPVLSADVVMPARPNIARPVFEGQRPGEVPVAPDAAGSFDAAYRGASQLMQSALQGQIDAFMAQHNPEYAPQMARLEMRLAELVSGGQQAMYAPAVENAIYERSRSRAKAESRRVQGEAWSAAARNGHTMPPGALLAAQQNARQAAADTNATASREIVVMQAELEQRNIQFALGLSADLRKSVLGMAIGYHGNLIQINGQALDYARSLTDTLARLYNMEVEAYRARLDLYRADVSVFETLIRASLADVELYKAEIEAERSKLQIDESKVRLYQAQIDAQTSAVTAWAKRVDGIVAVAGLEKLKLETFRSQVDAFQAETQAKGEEWRAYAAAWGGEEARVRAGLVQTQIYQAQIDGVRANLSAQQTKVQAQAEAIRAQLGIYTADTQAFGEIVRADAVRVQSQLAAQGSLVNAYQVASQAQIAQANVQAEQYRAQAQVALGLFSTKTQVVIEEARLLVQSMANAASVALSAGQSYAQMAGSAMAGMNTLVKAEDQGA